jgi:hypothetical protein
MCFVVLKYVSLHSSALCRRAWMRFVRSSAPQRAPMHPAALECASMCANTLHCSSMCFIQCTPVRSSVLQCVTTCLPSGSLQSAPTRFNVLQCVSRRPNALRYAQMRFTVLKCFRVRHCVQCAGRFAALQYTALECASLRPDALQFIPTLPSARHCAQKRFSAPRRAQPYSKRALQYIQAPSNARQCA